MLVHVRLPACPGAFPCFFARSVTTRVGTMVLHFWDPNPLKNDCAGGSNIIIVILHCAFNMPCGTHTMIIVLGSSIRTHVRVLNTFVLNQRAGRATPVPAVLPTSQAAAATKCATRRARRTMPESTGTPWVLKKFNAMSAQWHDDTTHVCMFIYERQRVRWLRSLIRPASSYYVQEAEG